MFGLKLNNEPDAYAKAQKEQSMGDYLKSLLTGGEPLVGTEGGEQVRNIQEAEAPVEEPTKPFKNIPQVKNSPLQLKYQQEGNQKAQEAIARVPEEALEVGNNMTNASTGEKGSIANVEEWSPEQHWVAANKASAELEPIWKANPDLMQEHISKAVDVLSEGDEEKAALRKAQIEKMDNDEKWAWGKALLYGVGLLTGGVFAAPFIAANMVMAEKTFRSGEMDKLAMLEQDVADTEAGEAQAFERDMAERRVSAEEMKAKASERTSKARMLDASRVPEKKTPSKKAPPKHVLESAVNYITKVDWGLDLDKDQATVLANSILTEIPELANNPVRLREEVRKRMEK
jgi:hypothetical protein